MMTVEPYRHNYLRVTDDQGGTVTVLLSEVDALIADLRFQAHQKGIDAFEQLARDMNRQRGMGR